MADEAGIEPTTPGLEGRCSIRLSYSPAFSHCGFELAPTELPASRTEFTKARSADSSFAWAAARVVPQAVKYAVIPRSWRPGAMWASRMTRSARQQRKGWL